MPARKTFIIALILMSLLGVSVLFQDNLALNERVEAETRVNLELNASVVAKSSFIARLEAQRNREASAVVEERRKVGAKAQMIADLKREMAAAIHEREQQIFALERERDRQVYELEQALELERGGREGAEAAASERLAKWHAAEQELTGIKARLEDTSARLAAVSNEAEERRLAAADLEKNLADLEERQAAVETELERNRGTLRTRTGELKDAKKQVARLLAESSELYLLLACERQAAYETLRAEYEHQVEGLEQALQKQRQELVSLHRRSPQSRKFE